MFLVGAFALWLAAGIPGLVAAMFAGFAIAVVMR